MSKLILPRTFKDTTGKYPQHEGKPKLSYSQVNSWKDEKYHPGYIQSYFLKIPSESGIFAQAGTDFGTMVEWIGNGRKGEKPTPTVLTMENVMEVAESVEYKPNSIYEDLIVVDCGDFVIEGYADKCTYNDDNSVEILDYKTGNIKKGKSKYGTKSYMQTRLYAYQKEIEGYDIKKCTVRLYARKGNGSEKYPIYLTGEMIEYELEYNKKDVEKYLKEVGKIAKEISDCYKTYLKFFNV